MLRASRELGLRLDDVLDWELRDQVFRPQQRDRLLLALHDLRDVEAQGLEVRIIRYEHAQTEGIKTDFW